MRIKLEKFFADTLLYSVSFVLEVFWRIMVLWGRITSNVVMIEIALDEIREMNEKNEEYEKKCEQIAQGRKKE